MTADDDDYKKKEFLLEENEDSTPCKCGNPFKRNLHDEGGIDYIAIIGGFLTQFIVLGLMNNTGSLKGYWETEYQISSTHSSFPGNSNYGFMFITGLFATIIEKNIGFANMHCIGCLICSLALFCASISPSFDYVIVSYGVLFGIGASFAFFSSIYVQLYYFKTKMPITSGLISAGSGCGTMTLTVLLEWGCSSYGWRNVMCIFSAILLAAILLSLFYRTADFRGPSKGGFFTRLFAPTSPQVMVKPRGNRCKSCISSFIDFSLLKNVGFLIFVLGCFIFMLGYLVPFLYIKDLVVSVGVNSSKATKLVGFMSIASLVGKIAIGNFAVIPHVKPIYVFQGCLLLIGISHICTRFCFEFWHFVLYSVVFGFFEGGYVSLTSVVVVNILGQDKGPSGLGLLYALKAIPVFAGAPLIGILNKKFGSYSIIIISSGASAVLASSILSLVPCFRSNSGGAGIREDSESLNEKQEIDDESLEVVYSKSRQVL